MRAFATRIGKNKLSIGYAVLRVPMRFWMPIAHALSSYIEPVGDSQLVKFAQGGRQQFKPAAHRMLRALLPDSMIQTGAAKRTAGCL
jgi:hypothetical protein